MNVRKHNTRFKLSNKKNRNILTFFLTVCMFMNGIHISSMKVSAAPEGEASSTPIYATFNENNEPTDFSLTQTEGKDFVGNIIRNGTYSAQEEFGAYPPLYLDNARVTYPTGVDVNPYDFKLSGQSELITDVFTVTDSSNAFEGEISDSNINDFIDSFENKMPYSFTFKNNCDWAYWMRMDTLTVNEGVNFRLVQGIDGLFEFSNTIEANEVTINGNLQIENSNVEDSNILVILEGGKLTVNNSGSLTGNGNAVLILEKNVTVTGIDLYDRFDGESGEWIKFTADGTQNNTGDFVYYDGKWVLANAGPDGNDNNTYRVIQIGDSELTLKINGSEESFYDRYDFTKDQEIEFTITPNTENDTIYAVYATTDLEHAINGTNDVYSYTPTTDDYFEIFVYTTEEEYNYDQLQPGENQFAVEFEVRTNGYDNRDNIVTYPDVPKVTVGNDSFSRTKLIFANDINSMQIRVDVAEGYKYEIRNMAESNIIVENVTEANTYDIDINSTAENRFEICFHEDNNQGGGNGEGGDGPGPGSGMNIDEFVEFIENSMFAFGDWDLDGDVDDVDVISGMADQIYYPELNGRNQELKDEFGINESSDLVNKISLTRNTNNDITAYDVDNNPHTIPAYDYTVTLKEADGNNPAAIEAHGTAYAFAFADTNENDKFIKNSLGLVLAVAEKNGNKQYFLRVASAYDTTYNTPDTQPIVYDENVHELSIVIVADYDVDLNENKRNVAVFGNGVSLDHLLSQENDANIAAFQGRNEDFFRDIGKSEYTTFSTFTFVQTSFMGVDVRGSGAEGNTPSWSFNQYKVFSTSDDVNAENEAVVFFGNDTVHIKPTSLENINRPIDSIASISVVDNSVPRAAVEITAPTNESKEWLLEFKSSFYDNVRFEIVYNLSQGGTATSYITIHRVGVDILSGNSRPGSSGTLFHGTENGPSYTSTGDYVIWGTYYYPNSSDPAVDLYVTYTWKDNTVTRETVANTAALNMSAANGNARSSDYILYDGDEANAPKKIEVIALVSGFENKQTFSGAKFGSGKGVVWNNYAGN